MKKVKEKNTYFTKDELKIFDKYFPEYYDLPFRSNERETVIKKAFNELIALNPDIKYEKVKIKFNNLRTVKKSEEKKKEKDLDAKSPNNEKKEPQEEPPKSSEFMEGSPLQPHSPPLTTQRVYIDVSPTIQEEKNVPQQIEQQPQEIAQNPQSQFINQLSSHEPTSTNPYADFYSAQSNQDSYFNNFSDGFQLQQQSSNFGNELTASTHQYSHFNHYFGLNSSQVDSLYKGTSTSYQLSQQQFINSKGLEVEPPQDGIDEQKLFKLLDEIDDTKPDISEEEINRDIHKIYQLLHFVQDVFKVDKGFDKQENIIPNSRKMNFLKKVEHKFIKLLKLIPVNGRLSQVPIRDPYCQIMYRFNDSSSPPSSGSSSSSQSSLTQPNSKDGKYQTPIEKVTYDPNSPSMGSYHFIHFALLKKTRHLNLDQKLLSFFVGESEETNSMRTHHVTTSTFISYTLNLDKSEEEGVNEFCVGIPVYGLIAEFLKAFRIHFLTIPLEFDSGFFMPIRALYFDRQEGRNKLYACGDVRVKEFTITGLDEYVRSVYTPFETDLFKFNQNADSNSDVLKEKVKVSNTNTFFFGEASYSNIAITSWKDELVLGCNSTLYFWKTNEKKCQLTIDTEENVNEAKKQGIDVGKVDWSKGERNYTTYEIENMDRITSLVVISKEKSKSYLAVASDSYPIIYIFNEANQNIVRLISHTMPVTSLASYGFNLYSGSIDRSVKLWGLNQATIEASYIIMPQRITAIEIGFYGGELFMFSGGDDHCIRCWSVNHNMKLFDIQLSNDVIPTKIAFISGNNKDKGEYAVLMVLSECIDEKSRNQAQFNYFPFD